jgi:nicotinate-nucleotide adenylyltransferase
MPLSAPIGLLGGSFDPVHVGHLQLARDALRELGLAEIRFIPAPQPWQKGPMTDPAHRARMVQIAIAGEPRFVLDMHEIERGGPTYTIDTLQALRSTLGASVPLVLIMGSDQFERLHTWRDWNAIPRLVHIAIARRAGKPLALNPELSALLSERRGEVSTIARQSAGSIVEFPMTPVDASATEARHLLGRRRDANSAKRLAAIVPLPVLDYIRAHRLYT